MRLFLILSLLLSFFLAAEVAGQKTTVPAGQIRAGAEGQTLSTLEDGNVVWSNELNNSNRALLRHSGARGKLCNIREGNTDSLVILLISDSQGGDIENYTAPLKRYGWANYGYKGTGWQSASTENTAPLATFTTTSGTVQNLGYNQNGGGLIDDKLIMSLNARKEFRAISAIKGSFANVVDIYYELGTGDFTVTSNPSGWNQFVENSTGSGLGVYKMDFGTLAGHEIFVNANQDGVELYGINRYVKDVSGVILHKATSNGYSLYRSENLVALQRHKDIVQSLDPDLIIIALGTNFAGREVQAGNPTTPNAMAGNIDSVRRAYEQLLPNAEFVHWGHADKLENPSEPDFVYLMKEYDDIFFRTAVKNNYSYLSFYKFHGPARKMLNTGILEDSVHYSALGALAHRDFILDYTLGDCSTESREITVAQGLFKGDDVIKLGRQKNNGAETANMTESREITGASGLHLNLAGGVGLSIAPPFRTPLNGSLLYAENQNNTANTAYFTGGSISVLSVISTGTATGLYARSNGTGVAADFRLGDGTAPSASAFVTRINKLKAPSGFNGLSAASIDINNTLANGDGGYSSIYVENDEYVRVGARLHDLSTSTREHVIQVKDKQGAMKDGIVTRGSSEGSTVLMSNGSIVDTEAPLVLEKKVTTSGGKLPTVLLTNRQNTGSESDEIMLTFWQQTKQARGYLQWWKPNKTNQAFLGINASGTLAAYDSPSATHWIQANNVEGTNNGIFSLNSIGSGAIELNRATTASGNQNVGTGGLKLYDGVLDRPHFVNAVNGTLVLGYNYSPTPGYTINAGGARLDGFVGGGGAISIQDQNEVDFTSWHGVRVFNQTMGSGEFTAGFRSDVLDGTNRYNFYSLGTAPNFLTGSLGIGIVPGSFYKLRVLGRTLLDGEVYVNNNKIQQLAAGTASTDAVNKGQLDAAIVSDPTFSGTFTPITNATPFSTRISNTVTISCDPGRIYSLQVESPSSLNLRSLSIFVNGRNHGASANVRNGDQIQIQAQLTTQGTTQVTYTLYFQGGSLDWVVTTGIGQP